MSIRKYDVVRARASFSSFGETKGPPYGYHDNTGVPCSSLNYPVGSVSEPLAEHFFCIC